jgi:hypothetical protein
MAKALSPWRVLRPVLLAGAATLTWLTFSTSAATADTSTDSGSLLGGLTSSVSSLSAPLAGTVSPPPGTAAPAAAPAAAPEPGLLQPFVGSAAGEADQLVAAVPVLNALVPTGTVSTISAPVAIVTDEAAAGLVDAVAPPLSEAVPVLEPVLQPVADVVNGVTPLPVPLPVLDVPAIGSLAGADVPAGQLENGDESAANPASRAVEGTRGLVNAGGAALASSGSSQPLAGVSAALPGIQSSQPDVPGTGDPSPLSALVPAGPSSGAGSGSSASGSSGPAAWVDAFGLYLPLGGAYSISGFSEHAPSPVSFDPGSSPD